MSTTIKMLKADIGDAFIIEVKEGEESFTMVVDGGPKATQRTIVEEIAQLEHIDLMILTHYDSDHIRGILHFFAKYPEKAKQVEKYWVNCPHIRVRNNGQVSPNEMYTLKNLFMDLETEENQLNWRDEVLQGVPYDSPNGLVHIEVITPTAEARTLNEQYYDEHVVENRKVSAEFSDRVKADYDTPLDVLANRKITPGEQVVNNSSISFLMTINSEPQKKILMLGDVKSGDVYQYLTELREGEKFSKEHKLKVDAVKVPHHGSRYNLTSELLDIIECDQYLISTCGGPETKEGKVPTYNHPDRMTIAKILLHDDRNKEQRITLHFNYTLEDMEKKGALILHPEELKDASLNFTITEELPEICL